MLCRINGNSNLNVGTICEDKETPDSPAYTISSDLADTPNAKPGDLAMSGVSKCKRLPLLHTNESLGAPGSLDNKDKAKLPHLLRAASAPSGDLALSMRRSSQVDRLDDGCSRQKPPNQSTSLSSGPSQLCVKRRSFAALVGKLSVVPLKRAVTISSSPTYHDVTPYSEKYGQHPNFFNFSRTGERTLTDAGIADELRKGNEI